MKLNINGVSLEIVVGCTVKIDGDTVTINQDQRAVNDTPTTESVAPEYTSTTLKNLKHGDVARQIESMIAELVATRSFEVTRNVVAHTDRTVRSNIQRMGYGGTVQPTGQTGHYVATVRKARSY